MDCVLNNKVREKKTLLRKLWGRKTTFIRTLCVYCKKSTYEVDPHRSYPCFSRVNGAFIWCIVLSDWMLGLNKTQCASKKSKVVLRFTSQYVLRNKLSWICVSIPCRAVKPLWRVQEGRSPAEALDPHGVQGGFPGRPVTSTLGITSSTVLSLETLKSPVRVKVSFYRFLELLGRKTKSLRAKFM